MDNIAQIIKTISEAGIGLAISGEDIEVSVYQEEVDPNVFEIIKKHKEEIKLYLKSLHSEVANDAIPKIPEAASYELSSAQHRLWILSQFNEASIAYNLPLQMELKGDYDLTVLQSAIHTIVNRHEILRTVFKVNESGDVRQWILPMDDFQLPIEYHDLRAIPEKEKKAQTAIQKDAYKSFDLAAGPLIRICLLQLEDERTIFYCNMHHIISDAWSLNILGKEIFTCYKALKENVEFNLPTLRIHYKDYAVWQKKQQETTGFKESKAYWLKQLAGSLPRLDLPNPKPRPKLMTYNGKVLKTHLSKDLILQLRQFNKEQGGSMFMSLLTCLKVLLFRYTGQDDICVGIPIAGREQPDLQNQIGFYLNTLVLRNQLKTETSYLQFYKTVKENTLTSYTHNSYPFGQLVNDLELKRDLSRNVLFDVMFTMQNNDLDVEADVVEDHSQIIESDAQVAKFDIDIAFQEINDQIAFTVNYNTDVYAKDTIIAFINHYKALLENLLANPEVPVANLNYLHENEIHQLLHTFNDTKTTYPKQLTVIDLFKEQVRDKADEIALIYENRQLSYQELDDVSSQLAQALNKEYKLDPDDFVGVKLKRNEHLVIALLGVLKTSAAYVPIDPDYPKERVAYIEKNSQYKMCIDEQFMETFIKEKDTHSAQYTDQRIAAQNLAYAIYTSGSTGNPKGVMIEHGNLVNFIFGMDQVLGLNAANHLLALTSVSFDISVLELLYTLSRGILITLKSRTTDLTNFNQYLASNQVNLDFSLLFFSSQKTEATEKYKLVLDTVKYADTHDFSAVWLPERHFHEFGGIFPNPSVLGAALATVTKQINIRSGSVVLPLHDTIRVAEEWAVVDNLSNGRVSLSIASGWHSNDFVLQADRYKARQASMYDQIDELRALWRGEEIKRINGIGKEISLQTYPRPIQKELPIWVTSGGNEETFKSAARKGANILTHLLGQDIEVLQKNIRVYKETLAEHGHDPAKSKISLMLHTYIGEDLETVKNKVKEPFIAYLRSSIGLIRNMLKEFTEDINNIAEEDLDSLLELAFERYWNTSALLGTKNSCNELLNKLRLIGITEIACLVDFGLDYQDVIQGLTHLNDVKQQFYIPKPKEKIREIDSMQITPSYLKTLVEDEFSQDFLQSLKHLIVGGENFPQELVSKLADKTNARITNMYGPTETTIWSATQHIEPREKVTVGKPIQNTQVYILDHNLQLCPIGVIGTLYIGGHGVSRGYHNQENLTTERFINYQLGQHKEERIYNTGDLAKWLPDGRIELLGRIDNQVKVNGYRIELEEIENILLQHPKVRNTAVIAVQDAEGNKVLRGFIVTDQSVLSGDLRAYLSERLPHYMVPANFAELDALPLTSNGKIDRNALVMLEGVKLDSGIDYIEPSNDIETKLVEIWTDVLNKPQSEIGIKSNFFDLGGNSILAIKLLGKINSAFNVQIPLVNIYSESNIQKLAVYLNGQQVETEVEEEHIDTLADTMESAFNKLINNEY